MRKNNGRALIAVACVLSLVIGLSACGNNSQSETISKEELIIQHSELITVEDTHWPDESEQTATVMVSVPSLLDAYQRACEDPAYNGENAVELMYSYLEESVTTISISVPASKVDAGWTLDEDAMERLIQEQIALDTDAFLNVALADVEPLKIELEWGDTP